MVSIAGLVIADALGSRRGIQDVDALNRLRIIGAVVGATPLGIIVSDFVAQREAQSSVVAPTTTTTIPSGTTQTMVLVPDVTGKAVTEAESLLKSTGLQSQRQNVIGSKTAQDIVIAQKPSRGETVPKGTVVILSVSLGVVVPNVTNQSIGDATAQLQDSGLQAQPVNERSSTVQKGLVISQNPQPDSTVSSGSTVTLTVSLGDKVTVPKVIEELVEAASKQLQDSGLQVKLTYQSSGGIIKGFVINQDPPADTSVSFGSTVTLTVSTGQDFQMPYVVGQPFSDAQKLLQSKNLQVQRVDQTSDAVRQNFVISQDRAAGTQVSPNSTVTLSVSLGIPQADLPYLIGKSFSEARETLQDLDFIVKRVDVDSDQPKGKVVNQEPKAGKVAPESQVTLYVSTGPAYQPGEIEERSIDASDV